MGAKLVIEKAGLLHNYLKIKDMCGCEVIPVLKSNAYGAGILYAARTFSEAGAKILAVSRVNEAELISNCDLNTDILILSSTMFKDDIDRAIEIGATLTAGSIATLQAINDEADLLEKKVNVHLLIDTGFSHSGLRQFEYDKVASILPTLRRIKVTGIFTQLSESHSNKPYFTEGQNEKFENAVMYFKNVVGGDILVHASNSCAAVKYPEMRYDAVRIGSGLIGRLPAGVECDLKKVGWFECEVAEIKILERNQFVGYSRGYRTFSETKVAIVPIGIYDGLVAGKKPYGRTPMSKLKDGVRSILGMFNDDNVYGYLGDTRVKVLGKISQHCVVVDIGDEECKVGDIIRFDANPLYVPSHVERKYI